MQVLGVLPFATRQRKKYASKRITDRDSKTLDVHCSAGISRSTTSLTAYLTTTLGPELSVRDCIQFIKIHRDIVCPNPGFRAQLNRFNDGPRSEARKLASELEADDKYAKEMEIVKALDREQIQADLIKMRAEQENQIAASPSVKGTLPAASSSLPEPRAPPPIEDETLVDIPPPPPPGVSMKTGEKHSQKKGKKDDGAESFFEQQEAEVKAKIVAKIKEEGSAVKAAIDASEQSGGVGLKWLGVTAKEEQERLDDGGEAELL